MDMLAGSGPHYDRWVAGMEKALAREKRRAERRAS